MEQFEEVFLEALTSQNKNRIIECFSDESRERADDFDEACEYIFEIYNRDDNPTIYGQEPPYSAGQNVPYDQITAPSIEEAEAMGLFFSDELSDPSYNVAKRCVLLFLMSEYNNLGSMWVRTEGKARALYCNARLGEDYGTPEGIGGFESIAEAIGI